jgi:hypothetical protein
MKKTVLAVVAALGLTAVAAALLRPDLLSHVGFGPERAVRKRAEGYWDARIENDPKKIAPFVHPLQKAEQENTLLVTQSYEITRVEVNGDQARVGIKAKYRLRLPQMSNIEREVTHDDGWVRYKGEWYHELHPVGLGEVLQQGLGKWKPPVDATPQGGAPK